MNLFKTEQFKNLVFYLVVILMITSIIVVYTASVRYSELMGAMRDPQNLAMKHIVKTTIAFFFLILMAYIPSRYFKDFTYYLMLLSIVLLIIVLIFGVEKKGSKRSIDFILFEIQPSFIALYAMIFHFARVIEKKGERIKDFKSGYLPLLIWLIVITVLVFLQPNFSQGSLIITVGLSMLYLGGARIKHIIGTLFFSSPLVLFYLFSAPYRLERISKFFERIFNQSLYDPVAQVRYSIYALGSGGLTGVGIGKSRFRELFIPEAYGDFIYAIFGEEYGFVGAIFLVAIYLIIFGSGIWYIKRINDTFSKLAISGIVITLMLYVFANTLVVIGLLPTTGLPLPFISYGGSATMMHAIGMGAMLNLTSKVNSYNSSKSDIIIYPEKKTL